MADIQTHQLLGQMRGMISHLRQAEMMNAQMAAQLASQEAANVSALTGMNPALAQKESQAAQLLNSFAQKEQYAAQQLSQLEQMLTTLESQLH
ncbi:MAG TPA: hypothetical protein VHS59_10430 [Bacillota bacterium]|nr:hypothetical protein [Bacillota bacterium]